MSRKHCLVVPTACSRLGPRFTAAAVRPQLRRAAFLGLMAAVISTAWGQTSVGRISGSVTDATGSAVVNATVTVTSTETGSARTATSDSAGFYAVTSLPIGHYTASVSMTGFQKQEQKDLNVVADGHVTADFQLKVGDLTQSVEVVATAAEQISTDSGEMEPLFTLMQGVIFL